MKNVSAILTADWHIREDTPVCRDESEHFAAQAKKIEFISELQGKHECPILIAGDIFHTWKPSPFLIGWFVEQFCLGAPYTTCCVPGQHDLPQHNKLLYQKSGLHVLDVADELEVPCKGVIRSFDGWNFELHPFWFGDGVQGISKKKSLGINWDRKQVALCHTFTWRGRMPWPGCTSPGASSLLKTMKGFDLVVTGDNHKAFTVEQDGQLLVNPGSIMRSAADQDDFKPRVYLWDAEANCVEPVFLPIEKGVVKRDHLERVQERDDRISSFVERLQGDWQVGLSFEENLERFFETNEVSEVIQRLIREAMERKGNNNA